MKTRILLTANLFIFGILPSLTWATSLDTLVNTNGFIQQGDKRFENFFAEIQPPLDITASPTSLTQIDVSGITLGAENGIRISSSFSANSTTQLSSFVLSLAFGVTVTDPNFLLHDVDMALNGGSVTPASIPSCCFSAGSAHVQLDSGVFHVIPNPPFPFVNINNYGISQLTTHVDFPIDVTNTNNSLTIRVQAFPFDSSASFSSVDVLFSQVFVPVPEPSTWLLLGSGLAGLILWRRRIV